MANNAFKTAGEATKFLNEAIAKLQNVHDKLREFALFAHRSKVSLPTANAATQGDCKKGIDAVLTVIRETEVEFASHSAKLGEILEAQFQQLPGGKRGHDAVKAALERYSRGKELFQVDKDQAENQTAQLRAAMLPDVIDLGRADSGPPGLQGPDLSRHHQVQQEWQRLQAGGDHQRPLHLQGGSGFAPHGETRGFPNLYAPSSRAGVLPLVPAVYGLSSMSSAAAGNARPLARHDAWEASMNAALHGEGADRDVIVREAGRDINIRGWNTYSDRKKPVNHFLRQLRQQVATYGKEGLRQYFRILLQSIQGEPRDWLETQEIPDTAEELERMLLAQFGITDVTAKEAENKIKHMRLYKAGLNNARDLAFEFEKWFPLAFPQCHQASELKMKYFKDCLPDKLIVQMDILPYSTYEDAKTRAVYCEMNSLVPLNPQTAQVNAVLTEGDQSMPAMGLLSLNDGTVSLSAIQSMMDKTLQSALNSRPAVNPRFNNRAAPYGQGRQGQQRNDNRNNGNQRGSAGQGSTFDMSLQCRFCGGYGHAGDCRQTDNTGRDCYNCAGRGHLIGQCPAPPRPRDIELPGRPAPPPRDSPGTDSNLSIIHI